MKLDPHESILDPVSAFLPTIAPGLTANGAGVPADPAFSATALVTTPDASVGRFLESEASGAVRSTVLPRVEIVGTEPTLIIENKRRFEPKAHLGEGGVGEVALAQDHDIGRPVALKRLRPGVKSPATLVRFVEEIRTVGRLEHPNIIPIHDVGVDESGDYYFVMKYIDGETLEAIIGKLVAGDRDYHRRYTFERRVEIWKGILDAVAFAHDQGFVHRDIKPSNVMVGRYGEVILMDWGIAKAIRGVDLAARGSFAVKGEGAEEASPLREESGAPPAKREGSAMPRRHFETQVGALVGTPAYMSPEQARGEPVDERSDIYSLCLVLYELLTLQHPLGGKGTLAELVAAILHEEPLAAYFVRSPYQPSVPPDLGWLVQKGLAKRKEDRYGSVAEILERLDRRADGDIPVECLATGALSVSVKLTRFTARNPLTAGGAFLGLLVLLVLFVYKALA
jgi:eukaryotic-like serine/threonine-protein kinase